MTTANRIIFPVIGKNYRIIATNSKLDGRIGYCTRVRRGKAELRTTRGTVRVLTTHIKEEPMKEVETWVPPES